MPDAGGDFVSARLRGRPATIRHAEHPGTGATIGRSRSDADAPGAGDVVRMGIRSAIRTGPYPETRRPLGASGAAFAGRMATPLGQRAP